MPEKVPIDDPYLKEFLTKSQTAAQNEIKDDTLRKLAAKQQNAKFKYTSIYIVGAIVIVILVMLIGYFSGYSKIRKDTRVVKVDPKNVKYEPEANVYFTPKGKSYGGNSLVGKIDYAYDVIDNPAIKYRLSTEDGKTLVYLTSSTNDLGILVGLNVSIKGNPTNTKINQIDIVDVESAQLK